MNPTTPSLALIHALDLTKRPPRSLRCRLGGYAVLPRLLDKCRAHLAGNPGEDHYNCPLDQQFLSFVNVEALRLSEEVAKGGGDGEVLAWIQATAGVQRTAWEITQWSDYQEQRAPEINTGLFDYFRDPLTRLAPSRHDIAAWADLLDLDDHCSFGGVA